jgi:hypothetical protein
MKRLGYTEIGEGEGLTAGEWVKARVKSGQNRGHMNQLKEQEILKGVKAKYYD